MVLRRGRVYVGDIYMAKLIETKQVLDLTKYLDSGTSVVKPGRLP